MGLRATAMVFSNRSDACTSCPASAAVRRHQVQGSTGIPVHLVFIYVGLIVPRIEKKDNCRSKNLLRE